MEYSSMDIYQHYDISCIISLLPTSKTMLFISELHRLDDYVLYHFERSNRFTFDKRTNGIKLLEYDESFAKEECYIYVDSVARCIHEICTMFKEIGSDIVDHTVFLVIAKYFETCFRDSFDAKSIPLNRIYFSFIVPNDLGTDIENLKIILTQLLRKTGAAIQSNTAKGVTLITELEGVLVDMQLQREDNAVPIFLQNQNRCIRFDIKFDHSEIQVQSIYFQFKEEYNLRLSGTRYCIPKMLEVSHKETYKIWEDFLGPLRKLVQDLLKLKSVDILLLFGIIESILIDEHLSNPVGTYFDEAQLTYLRSKHFVETVTSFLETKFVMQLSEIADYIQVQTSKIKYFRKFTIINTSSEESNLSLEQTVLFNAFIKLLQKRIQSSTTLDLPCFRLYNINRSEVAAVRRILKRKLIISTMNLNPVIVAEHEKRNKLCLPLDIPIIKVIKSAKTPGCIIYIDFLYTSTSVLCEIVGDGVVQEQFHILRNTADNLSSITAFIKSSLGVSISPNQNMTDLVAAFSNVEKSISKNKFLAINEKVCDGSYNRNGPVDRSPLICRLQSCLTKYLKKIVDSVNLDLQNQKIAPENVGYVLCLDKLLQNNLGIVSRVELANLFKESNVMGFKINLRKLIVVDQGEKLVWDMHQKCKMEPTVYYVHAHLSDDHIYLKLKKIVDTANSNEGAPGPSTILIKDKLIVMKNLYDQVVEALWWHICSSDNTEHDLKEFLSQTKLFIKEKIFYGRNTQMNMEDYEKEHIIEITATFTITISMKELMHVAIIPVLKSMVIKIVSCLVNDDVFGFFDITKLFITGGILKTEEHNELYHYMLISEMKKQLKMLIREKTYRTAVEIELYTSKKNVASSTKSYGQKHFCYDVFLKGELRIVFSNTYILGTFIADKHEGTHLQPYRLVKESAIKFVQSTEITCRSEEVGDRRRQVNFFRDADSHQDGDKTLFIEIYKLGEPRNAADIDKTSPPMFPRLRTRVPTNSNNWYTIQVTLMHHLSCIKITLETFQRNTEMRFEIKEEDYLFIERQTLKYF